MLADVGSARRVLFGRGAVYTVATALQAGVLVFVLPLATRLLTPEAFGAVATASVVLQLLGIAATLGIPSVLMLEYFSSDDGPRRARRLVGATSLGALLVVGTAEVSHPLWARAFAEIEYAGALRLAVWAAAAMAVITAVQGVLRSMDRPGLYVLVTGMASLGGHGLGLALLVGVDRSATAYLAGVLLGTAAGAVTGFVVVGAQLPRWSDRDLVRQALATGVPVVPHSLSMFALLAIDRVVIERMLGLSDAGRYQVAYLIGASGLSLVSALNNAWSLIVFSARDEDRWPLLVQTTRDLERVVVAFVVGVALLSPAALVLAAPGDYDTSALVPVVAVTATTTLPFLWYLSSVHVVLFFRRTFVLAVTTPTVAAFNVVVNVVLLPVLGLVAAAVATVVSYGLLAWRVRRAADRCAAIPWDRRASLRMTTGVVAGTAVALLLPAGSSGLAVRFALAALVAVWAARSFLLPAVREPLATA